MDQQTNVVDLTWEEYEPELTKWINGEESLLDDQSLEFRLVGPSPRLNSVSESWQPERPLPPPVKDRPGRNAPCWCGSGKKYKRCHWTEDERTDAWAGAGEDEDWVQDEDWANDWTVLEIPRQA